MNYCVDYYKHFEVGGSSSWSLKNKTNVEHVKTPEMVELAYYSY